MKNLATKNVGDFTITEDGKAYISQRKAAELCGVSLSTLQNLYRSNNIDIKQGVSSENLNFSVNHYAQKGRAAAIQTLIMFSQAGAKAYIYHQAGYTFEAKKPEVLPAAIPLPTPTELAQMLIKSEEEKGQLIQTIDDLKIAGLSIVTELGNDLYFNVAAKILETNLGIKLGHNTLMELLRANGYLLMGTRSIYEKNMPSQKHIELFRVIIHRNDLTGAMCHATVIRPEGLSHITPLVGKWLYDHTNVKRVSQGLVPLPPRKDI